MKNLFYDVETTGVNHWQHSIHQISGLFEIDGKIISEFDIRMQPHPKARIDPGALKIGGITEETSKTYMPFEDGYKAFKAVIAPHIDQYNKKDKIFLYGYNNAGFDNNFLRALFIQNNDKYYGSYFWPNPMDVYVLASEYLKDVRHDMVDFKLGTVAKHLGIKVDDSKLHDAMYDIYLTKEVYNKVVNKSNLEDLI